MLLLFHTTLEACCAECANTHTNRRTQHAHRQMHAHKHHTYPYTNTHTGTGTGTGTHRTHLQRLPHTDTGTHTHSRARTAHAHTCSRPLCHRCSPAPTPTPCAASAARPRRGSSSLCRTNPFVDLDFFFYWRFFDANPLLSSPRKTLLPGIAFLWRVKDPQDVTQDLSLLTMRTRYPLLSCAVLVLHLVKSAAANAGGLSFGALSHHRIEWPCACPSLSLSP